MQDTLGALGRVKGVATARAVVAATVVDSESPWESYAHNVLRAHVYARTQQQRAGVGLPRRLRINHGRALLLRAGIHVRTQYVVGTYRADWASDGWLLIEIDGDVKYQDKPVEAIRAEHRRQKELPTFGAPSRQTPPAGRATPTG